MRNPCRCTVSSTVVLAALALLVGVARLGAQPAAPGPDTIVFANSDQLVGHFVSATASAVTFKSDALGDITVAWSKVKELRTAARVAVIRKGVKLAKHANTDSVPQGTLRVESQNVQLASPPQPPQSIPLSDTNVIVDRPSFEKAVTHTPGLLRDWGGTVTAGGTLVKATQDNKTFTGAISLVRSEPAESWLSPRDRTSVDFLASYGDLSQPNTPSIKTAIFSGDIERDEYFVDSIFAFGRADYAHNYSQGLNLQQTYSGGVGWTAIEGANQTLDLKGGMSYVRQEFRTGPTQDLSGSVFGEHYRRSFKRGLILDQHLTVTPAWTNLSAYSAFYDTLLTMPVYKRFSASTGVIDTFLNDPPPGFKKNSFQVTLGLTYALR